MQTILRAALLLAAVSTVAVAQPTAYVAYDGARLYGDADYLSAIIDTLAIGDTLAVLEREKKFLRVRVGSVEGWVLAANVSEKPPKPTGALPTLSTKKTRKEKRGDGSVGKPETPRAPTTAAKSTASDGSMTDAPSDSSGASSGAASGASSAASLGASSGASSGTSSGASSGASSDATRSARTDAPKDVPPGTRAGSRGGSAERPATEVSPTAQCAATTRSGRQCTRKAGASSAYCWQHAK